MGHGFANKDNITARSDDLTDSTVLQATVLGNKQSKPAVQIQS